MPLAVTAPAEKNTIRHSTQIVTDNPNATSWVARETLQNICTVFQGRRSKIPVSDINDPNREPTAIATATAAHVAGE